MYMIYNNLQDFLSILSLLYNTSSAVAANAFVAV